ncbi:VCBS domain-containing protein, partial [Salinivibrio sp. KP-1]|uniref:VCBS domain-containing protein n=1 Tax=Salinivibrio sp. KP-1 TaxID=1406902 RepID=UPI0018CFD939
TAVTATGTIAISDVDDGDNPTFANTTEAGTYGSLELVGENWTYTLDQSAVQDLDAGDQVTDTITLTASDGTQQAIVITITGSEDTPEVTGSFIGSVTEGNVGDAPVTASGTLSISDVDGDDNPTFANTTETGTYGSLELVNGNWTYTLDQSAVQNLDAGDEVTDTVTLTASDNTQQDIVITITGTDDLPEVTGSFTGSVTEGNVGDAPVTATGTIAISDVDSDDAPTFANTTESGTYGSLELVNGNWTYTLDQSAVQDLDAGDQVTDTITLTASDNTQQDIVITITGTDDEPEVTGEFVGSVTEGDEGDAVTATGTIAISDVDGDDNPTFADTTEAGTYGSLELVNGNWTYTLDQSSVQDLDAGDQVTDTITLTASDNTQQDIVITITGTDDLPEVTGSFTGSVTEGDEGDAVTATGTIAISDVDGDDNPTFADVTQAGTYGSLELVDGAWTYTLDQSAVQDLDAGNQVTDTITLTASDNTQQDIVITITGSEDLPEVTGEFIGSVTEGNEGDAPVTATGTIAISDVDDGDNPTFANTTEAGTYGSLELVDGAWTYTLDQSAVQDLDAGDEVTDTITLTASDNTQQDIVITITGTEDAPEASGEFVGSVTEGDVGDTAVTATGTISISDVDGDDNPTFADVTQAGTYGSLELVDGDWTYTLDQDSVQDLDTGDQVTDTITLTASDGTQQAIVITITGSEDTPEVTGSFIGSVTEGNVGDAPVTASGTLSISDVDGDDNPTFANTTETGTYGSLELVNGSWIYTLDQSAVQDLDGGDQVTDTITLTASDNTQQDIVITITGTDDAPEVSGEFVGSVTEGDEGDAVTATGTIALSDVDGDDNPTFADVTQAGTYGSLELVGENWTYTLNQGSVQDLDAGDQVTDTITLTASDNTQQDIVITITGTDDLPEVTGNFTGSVTEGNEDDAPVTATG